MTLEVQSDLMLAEGFYMSPTRSCIFCWQDTTTLVVDDREIEVLTAVLMTASEVFKAMITSDFLERKTGRITLPGKSYDGVEFMVNYITSPDYVPIAGNSKFAHALGPFTEACINP